ncbi:MAG TPA: hypothetical protein VGE07_21585, partial [Herpetosiphonaceae bacterium]
MGLDLRLTTLGRLDEVLALPATTISVGHDGCPHKLPPTAALQQAAATIRAHGKGVTFVAPILYERFSATVLERIDALIADGPTTVVVNDYGLLLMLVERGWQTRCTVVAGQGLSYSFEQQPWLDLTLEQEAADLRALWYDNSLADPGLLPQLTAWGVRGIEAGNLSHVADAVAPIQAAGLTLNVLLDHVPIAYARSCHTARYYKMTPGAAGCADLCERPFELTTTHRWRLYHNQLEPMGKATRALVPDMTVYGNIVYRSTTTSTLPAAADTITLDVRCYTPDAL